MKHIRELKNRLERATGIEPFDIAYRTGSRIRFVRKMFGLSQAEVGEKIDLSADRIQKYENGARKPRAGIIRKIAEALGINYMALVDPVMSNPLGAMFALFEMETLYDLKIGEKDGRIVLSFGDGVCGELHGYLKEWESKYSSYIEKYAKASSDAEARLIVDSYIIWKFAFAGAQSESILKSSERQLLEEQIIILQKRLDKLNKMADKES